MPRFYDNAILRQWAADVRMNMEEVANFSELMLQNLRLLMRKNEIKASAHILVHPMS
jgi:hypothetical protein